MSTYIEPPNANSARQATHSIRGYDYQAITASLAWIALPEDGKLYLEVAEDYAQLIGDVLSTTQVKDTRASGSVTLNNSDVRDAIAAFVDIAARNKNRQIEFRFCTTSSVGGEVPASLRPEGIPGIQYWERAQSGLVKVGPLRDLLMQLRYSASVHEFCRCRDDAQLLRDLVLRIHWDCGKPDANALREELAQRLTVLLRETFQVPASEVPRVVDGVIYRVIRKSALSKTHERVLTRGELYQVIDDATSISVPRVDIGRILSLQRANIVGAVGLESDLNLLIDPTSFNRVVDGSQVPVPNNLIPRKRIVAAVVGVLKSASVCQVFGATGSGKSMVCRSLASEFERGLHWVDFRHALHPEAQALLNDVRVMLADIGPSTLILEDLNCIEDAAVQTALGRLIVAARNVDSQIVITSYRRLSPTIIEDLALTSDCTIECPYFEKEDSSALVDAFGGDSETWGRVAHIAGAFGHPQLTHAFIAGMATRNWPIEEMQQVIAQGFTSADLEATRNAARKNLITRLPGTTRELLHRLTIIFGPFTRSLAVNIGGMPPAINSPGECFDQLLGSWIEIVSNNLHRASPLVQKLGHEMLPEEEQRQVHKKIASELLKERTVDVQRFDAILLHSLAGKAQQCLARLAQLVITADEETTRKISGHVVAIRLLQVSTPPFPSDIFTSVTLRLAQFKLLVVSGLTDHSRDVVVALLREVRNLPEELPGPYLEALVLGSVLSTVGIANQVENWVALLCRFQNLRSIDDADGSKAEDSVDSYPVLAGLFNIGIYGLGSVEKLERIFHDLAELKDQERLDILTPLESDAPHYAAMIQGPWTMEGQLSSLKLEQAVASYKRMGDLAKGWGNRNLSAQCYIAASEILAGNLGDTNEARRVLDNSLVSLGDQLVLHVAIANLCHRTGRHDEVVQRYKELEGSISDSPLVDGLFPFREAAISAAHRSDWQRAGDWFLRAKETVRSQERPKLASLGIGLVADAAVARYHGGDVSAALLLLRGALVELDDLDPDSELQASYCHRIVRHTILWVKGKEFGENVEIEGGPLVMTPGLNSNPEPLPAISSLPLGDITYSWYMLAEIEVTAGLDEGIRDALLQRTAEKQIPAAELILRVHTLQADISRQDALSFSHHLFDFVAITAYVFDSSEQPIIREFSATDALWETIPDLPLEGPFDDVVEGRARHAILAYGIKSLVIGEPLGILRLRDVLEAELSYDYPGKSLFNDWERLDSDDLDSKIAEVLHNRTNKKSPPPRQLWIDGYLLFHWCAQSHFRKALFPYLAIWLKDQWSLVVQHQRFRLIKPSITGAAISLMLQEQYSDDQQFMQMLIAATAGAVGITLG